MNETSVVIKWIDEGLKAVENNPQLGPTGASRAYGILVTAMYDAWSAYEDTPISTQLGDQFQRSSSENTLENKEVGISYAAYRVLAELFPSEEDVTSFNRLMHELRLNPSNTSTDITTAPGIGNIMADALMKFRLKDGSNQLGADPNGTLRVPYSDISGYKPVNGSDDVVDIEYWQPLQVPIDVPNGEIQKFLTPHWGGVIPFALESGDQFRPPAPEPFLMVDGTANLKDGTVTLKNGTVVNLTDPGIVNPAFIAQAEQIVEVSANLTDEQKLIAEFWEDGAGTSFPPGSWMNFGKFVSERDNHILDEDIKLFFALGNAVFDAGIATWEAKEFYDYVRPVTAIRQLGKLGLIGEFNQELGGFAIEAWGGSEQGTETILASDFITYQMPGSHVSPPFAEYTSGHSAFSAAGAQVLKLFTGSDEFDNSVTFKPGASRFEPNFNPQQQVTLEWGTFTEAANEAGISRIYGGIHFEDGDLNGRKLGRQVATNAFEQAQFFIEGGEPSLTTSNKQLFGSEGDDILNGSISDSNNLLFGDEGNDILLGGSKDRLIAGDGDDQLFVSTGGGTTITGSDGADQFWIANTELPDALISAGNFPNSINTITDFELGVDVIGVRGLGLEFSNLILNQDGDNTRISTGTQDLAIVLGIHSSNLSEANFTFA